MKRVAHRLVVAAVVALAAAPAADAAGVAVGPLRSAIIEPDELARTMTGREAEAAFARMKQTGATAVITRLSWIDTAPTHRPASFRPDDPNDRAYDWSAFDRKVKALVAHGFTPLVTVNDVPSWARLEPSLSNSPPRAAEMGAFMKAAARRYNGTGRGLPRVRHWQIWIEPNLSNFFRQIDSRTGRFTSPDTYRAIVNASADALHSVRRDNVVMAGGTAPFRDITPAVVRLNPRWGPLTFMRALFCLGRNLRPVCRDTVKFDVWTHHPYTSGGPTHQANLPDDVSLGDLRDMRRTLDAGIRTGRVKSARRIGFWITEFSWDSKPPDPKGVPMSLLQRWVAEGMYRMWRTGVSLVAWLQLRDAPMKTSFVQSGLYFRGRTMATSRAKPTLQAFRFPVVGFRAGRRSVDVWGRTPSAKPARVLVEQRVGGRWRTLGVLSANRYGVFRRRFATQPQGFVRARVFPRDERSIPFSLKPVPDRFFCAFGYCGLTKPPR